MNAPFTPSLADTGIRLAFDHDGAGSALAGAVRDFLHALDRGDFGDLRIGPADDRAESAYVADLRTRLAAFDAVDASPIRAGHSRSEIAADIVGRAA